MAILKIKTYPDAFLKQPTKPLDTINGSTQKMIDDMAETMYQAPGVGLAAIQAGFDKSVIVYDVAPRDANRDLRALINPRILEKEGSVLSENEGCLSVPDFRADVTRSASVVVVGVARDGNPVGIEAQGLLAIVMQHEIDHLNGRLFIDRISALKREMYKRRVKKQLKKNS